LAEKGYSQTYQHYPQLQPTCYAQERGFITK